MLPSCRKTNGAAHHADQSRGDRVVINGAKSTLDQFRGIPYLQTDLRVSRPSSSASGGRSRRSSNSSTFSIATIPGTTMLAISALCPFR